MIGGNVQIGNIRCIKVSAELREPSLNKKEQIKQISTPLQGPNGFTWYCESSWPTHRQPLPPKTRQTISYVEVLNSKMHKHNMINQYKNLEKYNRKLDKDDPFPQTYHPSALSKIADSIFLDHLQGKHLLNNTNYSRWTASRTIQVLSCLELLFYSQNKSNWF